MEDKIGVKQYLGIIIDYDKEKELDKFTLDTLYDRYLFNEGGETHAKKLLQELQYMVQRINLLQTLIWLRDFMSTVLIGGSCLALLSFLMVEPAEMAIRQGVFLLAASSIMFLILGMVCLLITMKIFGWLVQVEGLVDIGEMLGVMVFLLLTIVVLLVQFLS